MSALQAPSQRESTRWRGFVQDDLIGKDRLATAAKDPTVPMCIGKEIETMESDPTALSNQMIGLLGLAGRAAELTAVLDFAPGFGSDSNHYHLTRISNQCVRSGRGGWFGVTRPLMFAQPLRV